MDDTAPVVVLQARDVTKRYGSFEAVRGLNFEVARGSCYGLLGPNGAGKTTLFRMLTAQARRTSGALEVFGLDPARREAEVKARLGVVGQEDSLDPDLDVLGNLRAYARFFGIRADAAFETRVQELLAFLELDAKARVPIAALSGGMKRRLMIIRALLNDPELLLLDEPTTGLDPQVRHAIWATIRALKARGLTILLTTHYMEEAAQLADRVGIMDHGQLVAEDAPAALVEAHLPAHVLEYTDPEVELPPPEGGVRRVHGDRVYLFHDALEVLNETLSAQPLQGALLRRAGLEDVFLELTGRSLRD